MFNIAFNTFRELLRNKILYGIIAFSLVFIGVTFLLSSLSLGDTSRFVRDIGLAGIEMFGLVLVLFVGSQILFREIDGKTVYLILTKPISRSSFIVGKFLGFSGMLLLVTAIQSLVFIAVLWGIFGKVPTLLLFLSIIGSCAKLLILFAILLLFSTFVSSFVSILVALITYFIAHGIAGVIELLLHSKNPSPIFHILSRIFYGILPNFEALNFKDVLDVPSLPVHHIFGFQAPYALLWGNLVYALGYIAVTLGIACFIFSKKAFEK